jgi:hypothetical protein
LQEVDRAGDVRVDDVTDCAEVLVEEGAAEATPGIRQQVVDGPAIRASTPSGVARSATTGVTVTPNARSLSAAVVIAATSAAIRRSKPFSAHSFAR